LRILLETPKKPSLIILMIQKNLFNVVKTMAEFLFLLMNDAVQNPAEFYLSRFSTEDAKRDKNYKELQALDLAFNSDLVDQQINPVKARSIVHNMYTVAPQILESQILPQAIKNAAQELLQGKYPKTVNELVINGNDIMKRGLQGKAIGDMQKAMLIRIYADNEEIAIHAKSNVRVNILPIIFTIRLTMLFLNHLSTKYENNDFNRTILKTVLFFGVKKTLQAGEEQLENSWISQPN